MHQTFENEKQKPEKNIQKNTHFREQIWENNIVFQNTAFHKTQHYRQSWWVTKLPHNLVSLIVHLPPSYLYFYTYESPLSDRCSVALQEARVRGQTNKLFISPAVNA